MYTRMSFFIAIAMLSSSCFKEKRSEIGAEKMQEFVSKISSYSRSFNESFIVIPQNGIELAFENLEVSEGFNQAYMSAISGIGVEELFYNGNLMSSDERLPMLESLSEHKKVLVSEYISNDADVVDAIAKNSQKGFICFPRVSNNYDYLFIPEAITESNSNDILNLNDVKNYLYLISTDNFADKEEMIAAITETDYDLILIDLFFDDSELTFSEVNSLKTKKNGGKRLVISYMSIGSAENYRYYWKNNWGLHHPLWLKRKYDGYKDEFWVKFWKDEWKEIIYGNDGSYTKKIINAGFDGVFLDNVEAYYFLYFRE